MTRPYRRHVKSRRETVWLAAICVHSNCNVCHGVSPAYETCPRLKSFHEDVNRLAELAMSNTSHLSPARRSESARYAAAARWHRSELASS